MRCIECGKPVPEGAAFCPACGKAVEDKYQGFSMGWYKFLINFALWLSVLAGLVGGVSVFATLGGGNGPALYDAFPGLELASVVRGCWSLGQAVLAFAAAVQLRALRKSGPILLYVLYAAGILGGILYLALAAGAVSGALSWTDLVDGRSVLSFCLSVLMLILNVVYFKKRAVLFR